jgi:hypothetical protein
MSVSPKDVAWLINSTVDDLEACMKENDELREQLAAEKEETEGWKLNNVKLSQKLAAEKEAYRRQALSNHTAQDATRSTIKYLQQQLASEKATVREYEDYIKSLDRIAGIEAE